MTISDRIRKQLDQPDGVTAEALEPLAVEFDRESVQVNARLAECVDLLRKGLRSEAIQRAFMKPNILDWSAQLDFPEFEEWLDILKFYGITVPTLLDRDAAQQLQEAIVDAQPLDELLRQHRRLAIAKAPLSWRLKVLRTLVKTDSFNPVWREDQEQWETIRLKQIPGELKRAIESKEISTVRELAAELNNSEWAIKPPLDLCKSAANFSSAFQFEDQVLQLRSIADRLHAAYSEGNESAASRQYQSWKDVVQSLSKPVPGELAQSVEPAVEWLRECAEEKRKVGKYENATAVLNSSLQQKKPLADLQRAYYDLTSLQMGVEPILEQRYQTAIASMQQNSRRRMQMTYFAIATSAVSMLILFGLWQWNRTYRIAVSDSAKRLTSLIESNNLSEADSLVQRLATQAPDVAKSPEVASLFTKLTIAQEAESVRRKRAAALIEDAKAEDSSQIDISKVIAAEKAAVTTDEKDAIRRIRLVWEEHDRKIRDGQFQLAKDKIQAAEQRLEEIKRMAISDVSEQELLSIVLDLGKIMSEFPKSGMQNSKLLDIASERAGSMLDSVRQQRRELEQRQRSMIGLRGSNSQQSFESEMKTYIDSLPGDSISKEFSEVLTEARFRIAIDRWNNLCKEIGTSFTNGISEYVVDEWVKTLDDLESKLKGLPEGGVVAELKELASRMATRASSLDSLAEELNNSVIGELVTLVEPVGTDKANWNRRFMTYESRVGNAEALSKLSDSSRISLPVISDALGAVSQENFRGKLMIVDEPRSSIRKITKRIETDREEWIADWEMSLLGTIREVTANPVLDGKIKELLLVRLLKAGRAGSQPLSEGFKSLEEKLNDSSDSRTLWYLRSNLNSSLEPDVMKLLQSCEMETKKKRNAAIDRIRSLANKRMVWIGAMLRNSQGRVEPWLYRNDVPDGEIFTTSPIPGDKDRGQIVAIGTIGNKELTFQNNPEVALAGRPLFWLRLDQPAKQ